MPIAELELARRVREIGRIRLGDQTSSPGGRSRPRKLERFRLTTPDRRAIDRAAELWGGEVKAWQAPAGPQWELYVEADVLPVVLVPAGVTMTQWLERWSGGGCQRRCDGLREVLSDGDCLCEAEGKRTCQPTTRLNVMLPDLPGLGVWRLESHGWNAAAELPTTVQILGMLGRGGFDVAAHLSISQRVEKRAGETRRYVVPVLDLDVTPAQLLAMARHVEPELPAGAAGGLPSPAGASRSVDYRDVVTVSAPALNEAPSDPVADPELPQVADPEPDPDPPDQLEAPSWPGEGPDDEPSGGGPDARAATDDRPAPAVPPEGAGRSLTERVADLAERQTGRRPLPAEPFYDPDDDREAWEAAGYPLEPLPDDAEAPDAVDLPLDLEDPDVPDTDHAEHLRRVARELRQAGVDDDGRHAVARIVSGGRTASTTDLTLDDMLVALRIAARVADGDWQLRYGSDLEPAVVDVRGRWRISPITGLPDLDDARRVLQARLESAGERAVHAWKAAHLGPIDRLEPDRFHTALKLIESWEAVRIPERTGGG